MKRNTREFSRAERNIKAIEKLRERVRELKNTTNDQDLIDNHEMVIRHLLHPSDDYRDNGLWMMGSGSTRILDALNNWGW